MSASGPSRVLLSTTGGAPGVWVGSAIRCSVLARQQFQPHQLLTRIQAGHCPRAAATDMVTFPAFCCALSHGCKLCSAWASYAPGWLHSGRGGAERPPAVRGERRGLEGRARARCHRCCPQRGPQTCVADGEEPHHDGWRLRQRGVHPGPPARPAATAASVLTCWEFVVKASTHLAGAEGNFWVRRVPSCPGHETQLS